MYATIQHLNMNLPYCEARTAHDILFLFRPPASSLIHLGDVIDLDPHILDAPQTVLNVTTGERYSIEIQRHDVFDLRVPDEFGVSRFPTPDRLFGC